MIHFPFLANLSSQNVKKKTLFIWCEKNDNDCWSATALQKTKENMIMKTWQNR